MAGPNLLTTQATEGDTLATEAGNPYPVGLVALSSLQPAIVPPLSNATTSKVMTLGDSITFGPAGQPGASRAAIRRAARGCGAHERFHKTMRFHATVDMTSIHS